MFNAGVPAPVTSGWDGGTRWTAGPAALDAIRSDAHLGTSPVLLLDAGFADSNPDTLQQILHVVKPVAVHRVTRSPDTTDVSSLFRQIRPTSASALIAVGGGSTIDLALLVAVEDADRLARTCEHSRSGLMVLPPQHRTWIPVAAVPTTLGTGAEVSAAACCTTSRGKSLLLGRALRPAYAAVDPICSRGLPRELVVGALAEILARVLVPYAQNPVGASAVVSVADHVAGASLTALGAVGRDLINDSATVSGPAGDELRLRLATIGGHTHAGWGQLGRHRFSSPLWFVATELSGLTGWSKTDATRLLLPVWAAAVLTGQQQFGNSARLLRAWRHVEPDTAERATVTALSEFLEVPQLAARLTDTNLDIANLAQSTGNRVVHRWVGGICELAGIKPQQWASLVHQSLAGLDSRHDELVGVA